MLVVIGYGNRLCGDDGFGPRVAERLLDLVAERQGSAGNIDAYSILIEHQLYPELAESLAHADDVVFVDASLETAPAEVEIMQLTWSDEEIPSKPLTPHSVSPLSILQLCSSIYGRRPKATLYACGLISTTIGDEISEALEDKVEQVARLILERHF